MRNFFTLIIVLITCGHARSETSRIQHEKCLQGSTVFALSIVDFESFQTQSPDSPFVKYLNHPSIQTALWKPMESANNPVFSVLNSKTLAACKKKQVTYAIEKVNSPANSLVLISLRDDQVAKETLQKLISELETDGHAIESKDRSTSVKLGDAKPRLWLRQESELLMISDRQDLRPVDSKDSLSQQTNFAKSTGLVIGESQQHDFWLFCDPIGLIDQKSAAPDSFASISLTEGFDAIQGIGLAGKKSTGQNRIKLTGKIYAKKPFRRGMRLLNINNETAFALPPGTSNEWTSAGSINLDLPRLTESYSTIFDSTIGGGEDGVFSAVLEDLKDDSDGPGFDIENEIIANLVSPVYFFNLTTKTTQSTLVSIRIKDVEQVKNSIARFYKGDDKAKKLDGNFDAWMVEPLDVADGTVSRPYVVAVKDNLLFFAPTLASIQRTAQLMSETVNRKKPTPHRTFKEKYCFVYSLRLKDAMRVFHERLPDSKADSPLANLLKTIGIAFQIKPSEWPDFAVFEDDFDSILSFTLQSQSDGWKVIGETD